MGEEMGVLEGEIGSDSSMASKSNADRQLTIDLATSKN
jgi:hypothetical protein